MSKKDSEMGLDRRQFLGGVGGVTVGALAGAGTAATLAGLAPPKAEAAEIMPDNAAQRRNRAFQIRHDAALDEKLLGTVTHATNGDEELFSSRIGNFSKSMPHNNLGEVDPAAYNQMLNALASGSFDDFEAVPQGGLQGFANPLGGLTFSIEGPDSPAVRLPEPPPSITSAEWAAQMAELYWMAILRDVPFDEFNSHPDALAARADLAQFSGYTGPRDPMSGEIRAQDLFRIDYPGVTDGPMVSQFVLQPFTYDGIPIEQRVSTAAPGEDFLTLYDEWLEAQRGFPGGTPGGDPRDPVLRFARNVRDLGRTAGQDRINSQYFKATLILGFGAALLDAANPYNNSVRQGGFATFGLAHLVELVGKAHKSERHTWYQKWNVHRFLRPEAGGGRVHNVKVGAADYPIHSDLIEDSAVLDRIFDFNRQRNLERFGLNQGTYLLPQLFGRGSPTHPSFPAGHAVSAGACVTILKAWYNEDLPFPDPVKVVPNADPAQQGLLLEPYVAGVDGPELTLGGELNKLAHNLSFGRDMSGVHWRADNTSGNTQGEEVAIRILREEKETYPEPFDGFSLTKFDGTTITI